MAETPQLEGFPATLNLRVNPSYRERKAKTYVLTLLERDGGKNEIEAVGIPTITDTGLPFSDSNLRKKAEEWNKTRPSEQNVSLPQKDLHPGENPGTRQTGGYHWRYGTHTGGPMT